MKKQAKSLYLFLFIAAISAVMSVIFFKNSLQPSISVQDHVDEEKTYELNTGTLQALAEPDLSQVEKIKLGRDFFEDKLFSKDKTVSCSSCHDLHRGGADPHQFSLGVSGMSGIVNAPSVFNSSLNFKQFWDGRANSLAEQIQGPIHNPVELGTNWPEVLERLEKQSDYKKRFQEIYNKNFNETDVVDAIITFENTLITTNSPLDKYLKGETSSLTEAQLRGYRKFESYGCVACHQGRNLGGNMFQTLGIVGNYFKDRGGSYPSDLGRYNVTKREEDKYMFRVPSLRNVELTAPYFHDGTVKTLEDAIKKMAKYQLGRELSKEDITDLTEFLRSLTGERPRSVDLGRTGQNDR